jgi:glucose-1-phosphate adenylyltransferase
MLETHRSSRADVTIGGVPVTREQAAAFGIMRLDDSGRVLGFLEKPKTEDELKIVRTDPAWLDARGIESKGRDCLASMGIYLFNRDTLVELLKGSDYQDFGKEVFPLSIRTRRVQVHLFDGYWEDIGTIKAFYEANLALAGPAPPFEFAGEAAPLYTHPRFLPPTRVEDAVIRQSLVADGCFVESGATIENSVVGVRCRIGRNVTIRNSIIMGVDFYQPQTERTSDLKAGRPPLGVGEGSHVEGAIVDKNCRIGRGVRVAMRPGIEADSEHGELVVRDGVIVVPKEAMLEDGWSL